MKLNLAIRMFQTDDVDHEALDLVEKGHDVLAVMDDMEGYEFWCEAIEDPKAVLDRGCSAGAEGLVWRWVRIKDDPESGDLAVHSSEID